MTHPEYNDELVKAVEKKRTYNHAERIINRVAWFLVACISVVSIVSLIQLAGVKDSQDVARCYAEIDHQFFEGIAQAFNSPPAPNPQRSAAVNIINDAAKRMEKATCS